MSYTLLQLYEAIADSKRVLGRYTMSEQVEYGSGAVYFTAKEGKYRQVYMSPAWEQFDCGNGDVVIDGKLDSFIAVQIEEFDGDEHVGNSGACDIPLVLTGNLAVDLEEYFKASETLLSTLI